MSMQKVYLRDLKLKNRKSADKADLFCAHLDVCEQCRNHPFNLCPIGAVLLKSAAVYAMLYLQQHHDKEDNYGISEDI